MAVIAAKADNKITEGTSPRRLSGGGTGVRVQDKFGRYVAASMITMFLQSAYSLVDGLFVSNLIGGDALAAINVTWPIIAVITATGTGIGCGGAVLMSQKQGEGRQEESNIVRANTLMALVAAGILCTAVFLLLLRPLLVLMGAEGSLLDLGMAYGRIMIAGGTVQVLSCGLTALLRNDNRAVTAMMIMIGGLATNLTLDYVSMAILHLGIGGAAAASLCAQAFTTITSLGILLFRRENPLRRFQFVFRRKYQFRMLRVGISPFGISLTPSFLILATNIACLHSADPLAVSSYALISSTVGSYRILLIGVAEGMQPLASFAYGAGDEEAIREIRNKAIRTAVLVSVILFVFTLVTAPWYPALYGYTGEAAAAGLHAVRVTAAQLIFTGLVRVANSFFYATGHEGYSLFMIYFDPIIMTPVTLLILPHLFGTDGIWLTAVITQAILDLAAIWMFRKASTSEKKMQ